MEHGGFLELENFSAMTRYEKKIEVINFAVFFKHGVGGC